MQKGSVVVVAHNSGEQIEACLRALSEQAGWEVVLVDNASGDNTVPRARRFPHVRIICNQENRGFAAAVNQGVALVSGGTIVVLNPDAIAGPGALDSLGQALHASGAGAAGGLMLDSSGREQRGFMVRRFPGLGSMLSEMFLLNRLWPDNPGNRRYRCLDMDYTRTQNVDQPAGAALAFTRAAWEAVGGFDEGFYPVWFEDVDFCRRLRARGWKILFTPQASFRHGGGHSVMRLPFRERQMYWYGNLLRYFRKHHGAGSTAVMRAGIICSMVLRSALSLAVGGPGEAGRWSTVVAYLRIAWRCGIRGAPEPPARPAVAAAPHLAS